MMSLLERLNHAFSGGIMFVQPTAETASVYNTLQLTDNSISSET